MQSNANDEEMMGTTKISWCDKVWNPITGCSPVSEGCLHCYAKKMAYRLKGRHGYPKDDPFGVTFHPERLDDPIRWKKPSKIFVCSMGDLFHESIKFEMIKKVLMNAANTKRHTYLFLTKRPQRMKEAMRWFTQFAYRGEDGFLEIKLPKNFWLGVSVEDQKTADERIPILLQIPAAKRFVSVEPMLGAVDISRQLLRFGCYKCGHPLVRMQHPAHHTFDCAKCGPDQRTAEIKASLDLVICGGETGQKARVMNPDWVRELRGQCQTENVPFFFKGWGDHMKVEIRQKSNLERLLNKK